MVNRNTEVEAAQKTISSFKDAAEKHCNIDDVWHEMAANSKTFGKGSEKEKAYFHAVTDGLKKQGLLPELTVAYAQWHKKDMMNDDGDVGKYRIDSWSKMRKLENGRVCEVEQAFIDNLKTNFDGMLKTAHNKTGEYDHKGLSDSGLKAVNADYSKERHAKEQADVQKASEDKDARDITRGLFTARKDDGTSLYDKLAAANGGKAITADSIKAAEEFDAKERELKYSPNKKGWHSYLDYQDRQTILKIEQHFNDIAPVIGSGRGAHHSEEITKQDLNKYLKAHTSDK